MKELKLISWTLLIISAAWILGELTLAALAELFVVGWAFLVVGVIIGVSVLVILVGWDQLVRFLFKKYAPSWIAIDGTEHFEQEPGQSQSVKEANEQNAELDALEYLYGLSELPEEKK